ncbi:MAG: D-alanyl-D-alanine carboxypeptidase/D-alanyl-D-alanine-endopeptidase, partial [Candidatus Cloacimonadaceae bacterium]|nr:D-alanyl-D-alanine carboxypeptidase/D-alanyl-D-alanine-endopeptidase [Candidatus Cloacimonadaceae bacterium]
MSRFLIILILMQATGIFAAEIVRNEQSLTLKLDELMRSPLIKSADVALGIWDAEDGRQIYARNTDMSLIPASLQKLFTSTTALHELGIEHRFVTRVGYRGEIARDSLFGDLVVIADGDPGWTTDFYRSGAHRVFENWADSLYAHGIRTITGKVVINIGKFPVYRDSTVWDSSDFAYGYAAISAPFSFNENAIIYQINAGKKVKQAATISAEGGYQYLGYANQVRTGKKNAKADISVNANSLPNRIVISGTIPLGGTYSVRAAVPDPHDFTASVMLQYLRQKGIVVSGNIGFDPAPPANVAMEKLFDYPSPPLYAIMGVCVKRSSNLMAEMVYIQLNGGIATTPAKIRDFAARSGISVDSLIIVDGSGLSRKNVLKAEHLGSLLVFAHDQDWFDYFFPSLAVSGMDGTLKSRMVESPAKGRVFAKTGSMRGIRNIAGYFKADDGRLYAFVILCNK